jgi:hypothetical protein
MSKAGVTEKCYSALTHVVLVLGKPFSLVYYLQERLTPTPIEHLSGAILYGMLLSLPSNIIPGRKGFLGTNSQGGEALLKGKDQYS